MNNFAFIHVQVAGPKHRHHDITGIAVSTVDLESREPATDHVFRVCRQTEKEGPEAVGMCVHNGTHGEFELRDALVRLTPVLEGCVLAGVNVHRDWAFLQHAYRESGVDQPDVHPHLFDLTSLAWPLVIGGVIRKPTLEELCKAVGVDPRGVGDVRCDARRALEVCENLARLVYLAASMDLLALRADELEIVETIVERLHAARRECGPWRIREHSWRRARGE